MIKKFATIGLILLLVPCFATGQDSTPQERYLQQDIERHELNRQRWADLTDGIDYSASRKRRERPASSENGDGNNGSVNLPAFGEGIGSSIARFLLIALAAVIIALLVRSMLGYGRARDKKIKRAGEGINIQKIEENLHEADLTDYIGQAKAQGDYNMAVRLYYLAILKELSLQKAIKWKVDKTNNEYLREMRGKPHFPQFRALTLIFEQSWYGGRDLDAASFARLEPEFIGFIQQMQPAAQATAS